MANKRIVITGLGLCCALGENVNECWNNAINGVTGIDEVKSINTDDCYAKVGAEVKLPSEQLSHENYDRSSLLCIKATGEALADAGFEVTPENADRIGVIVGNCVGGAASIDKYYNDDKNGNVKKEDVLKISASAIANNVAHHFGLNGTTANIVNACAAGTISLSYAADLIRAGKADAFAAGGSDAFSSLAFAGFHALHALDENSCSPFNRSSGITLGEGAGVVIIEDYEHAKARGAKIYCEVLGSGVSSDAHHITAPRPDGEGQMLAISRAVANSGLNGTDLDYINAHGTGTAKNDEAEFLSLHTLFDENEHLSVSSTKSMTGHCLGAAGSIEAVFTVKAVCENVVPPTIGYTEENLVSLKEKAGKIDFVPNTKREKTVNFAASNSFAFGGNNASIIFAKQPHEIPDRTNNERIFVTGIGEYMSGDNGVIDIQSDDYKNLGIKMAFWRKLDRFSQLMLISGMRALSDANITINEENERDIGIIIGTADGPLTEIVNFQKTVIEQGTAAGSAFSFPNTVYNAAGGYFSIFAGIKGYNVTDANSIQAGLQSVCYAADVLRGGDESIMVAAGVDENTDVEEFFYERYGVLDDKFKLGEGAVSLILETETSAKNRGSKKYAELVGWASAHKAVEFGTLKGSEVALKKAILDACKNAGISPKDVSTVCGFKNGNAEVDAIQDSVFDEIFGAERREVNAKGAVEARAAGAAKQASFCAAGLANGELGEYALCVSFGAGGQYSAVVLKRV
ncbi:MAG: beta-ketoacyl synthase N-terminal-like domain-containing protein [Oscillospiraceae bacterium]